MNWAQMTIKEAAQLKIKINGISSFGLARCLSALFFQNGKKHLKQQHEQLLASTSVAAFKDFCGVFCSLYLGEDEQLQHEWRLLNCLGKQLEQDLEDISEWETIL